MTDGDCDMRCLPELQTCSVRRYPAPEHARAARPRRTAEENLTRSGLRCRAAPYDDGRMSLDIPEHLVTAIDHVGIAVPDLDAAKAFYLETFGMETVHEETNAEQGVREA